MSYPKKNLAEDSFRLSISTFGRGLLLPRKKIENENLYFLHREAGEVKGLAGSIEVKNGNQNLKIHFNVDVNTTPKNLTLHYGLKENNPDMKQAIDLNESLVSFGVRPYFACQCGRSASVLYRPKGQNIFKCRICSRIIYESTRINKQSLNGLPYCIHRLTKLADKRENIERMYYAGRLTKKGEAFMREYRKWQSEVGKRREILIKTHKMLSSHNI